jgi:hypothetical protein
LAKSIIAGRITRLYRLEDRRQQAALWFDEVLACLGDQTVRRGAGPDAGREADANALLNAVDGVVEDVRDPPRDDKRAGRTGLDRDDGHLAGRQPAR